MTDTGAICGGAMRWSDWVRLKPDELDGYMMCMIRRRVRFRGHYRYKIIDPLGGCWFWEDEKR